MRYKITLNRYLQQTATFEIEVEEGVVPLDSLTAEQMASAAWTDVADIPLSGDCTPVTEPEPQPEATEE